MAPAAAPAQQQPAVRDTPDAFVYLPRIDIENLLKQLNKQEHIKYSEVRPLTHASSKQGVPLAVADELQLVSQVTAGRSASTILTRLSTLLCVKYVCPATQHSAVPLLAHMCCGMCR